MKKKVLLTGADGFIGRHSLNYLLERDYEVHAVSLSDRSLRVKEPNLFWYKCDLLDSIQQKSLVERIRPTHLLHFSWVTTQGEYWTSLENIRWVQASLELLLNFIDCGGKRVVFAGTCAEYDWNYNGNFSEVTTPLKPSTLYGASKKCLQEMLSALCQQTAVSSAWGRIFYLFGEHENVNRLVPSVIHSIVRGETIRCTHGKQIRDFLFVKDVASAFVALLESPVEGPVNIGSGNSVALKAVVEYIAKRLGHPELVEFGAIPVSEDDPDSLVADVSRLVKEVGWSPEYSLEEGLKETVKGIMKTC